jgi:hypothetical protein
MATVIMTIEASATTHRYDGPLPEKTLAAGKTGALIDGVPSGHCAGAQHYLGRRFGQAEEEDHCSERRHRARLIIEALAFSCSGSKDRSADGCDGLGSRRLRICAFFWLC